MKDADNRQKKSCNCIFTEEESRRSAEHGMRDVEAIIINHARNYPTLINHKLDEGDNVLHPMADKRIGIKRKRLNNKNQS